MPLTYVIDPEDAMVRLELTGPLRVSEIQRTVEELLEHPDFRPGVRLLSDHSRLEESATTELVLEIIPLLKQIAERLGSFRCAVVVTGDASFGMARMAEAYASPTPATVRAFRDRVEAEAWLREDTPTPRKLV